MTDYNDLIKKLRCQGVDCAMCAQANKSKCLKARAADAIEELVAECNQLRPKTGKWLPDDEDDPRLVIPIRCSVCHSRAHFEDWNRRFVLSEYCPHCGAKMEATDDKE